MKTWNVADSKDLIAALSKAAGGDKILVAPGDYGDINISNTKFTSPVTIAPYLQDSFTHFSSLKIDDCSNLDFQSIVVGSERGGEPAWASTASVQVIKSNHISFDALTVRGKPDFDFTNDRVGMSIRDSDSVIVSRSEFDHLKSGMLVTRSNKIEVESNVFHNIRQDGIQAAQVRFMDLSNNRFSDFFKEPTDHSDAIQLLTAGTQSNSANISIHDNIILQGSGTGTQGIFIRDETSKLPFEDVTIENNLVYTSNEWNGIAVMGAVSLAMTRNTVLSPLDDSMSSWLRIENVSNGRVSHNLTDAIVARNNVGVDFSHNVRFDLEPGKVSLIPSLNGGSTTLPADLLVSGVGYGSNSGAQVEQPTSGISSGGIFNGTTAGEIISGVSASENSLGKGKVHKLVGGGGDDLYILGDSRGTFYSDGAPGSGRADYAQVMDWSDGDKVQLAGHRSDYHLLPGKFNDLMGVWIIQDSNHDSIWNSLDEFVGHVVGMSIRELDAFTFA